MGRTGGRKSLFIENNGISYRHFLDKFTENPEFDEKSLSDGLEYAYNKLNARLCHETRVKLIKVLKYNRDKILVDLEKLKSAADSNIEPLQDIENDNKILENQSKKRGKKRPSNESSNDKIHKKFKMTDYVVKHNQTRLSNIEKEKPKSNLPNGNNSREFHEKDESEKNSDTKPEADKSVLKIANKSPKVFLGRDKITTKINAKSGNHKNVEEEKVNQSTHSNKDDEEIENPNLNDLNICSTHSNKDDEESETPNLNDCSTSSSDMQISSDSSLEIQHNIPQEIETVTLSDERQINIKKEILDIVDVVEDDSSKNLPIIHSVVSNYQREDNFEKSLLADTQMNGPNAAKGNHNSEENSQSFNIACYNNYLPQMQCVNQSRVPNPMYMPAMNYCSWPLMPMMWMNPGFGYPMLNPCCTSNYNQQSSPPVNSGLTTVLDQQSDHSVNTVQEIAKLQSAVMSISSQLSSLQNILAIQPRIPDSN